MKKLLSLVLVVAVLFTFTISSSQTTKAFDLFTKGFYDNIQKGSKIKVYHVVSGAKRVKWWTSNKKLKIVKKSKKYCIVKGKKTGKCYVRVSFTAYGRKYKIKKKINIKPKSKVTYKNYLKIHKGMSFSSVRKTLGKPKRHSVYEYDKNVYDNDYNLIGRRHMVETYYTWYNEWKSIYIYVDFENGKATDYRYSKY